jgi:peptidoglycan hydrolase CwlO-like protein
VAGRRRRSSEAEGRLGETRNRLAEEQEDIVALEAELAAELTDLVNEWHEKAVAIDRVEVPLEKSDVAISAACLLWIPMPG